MRRSLLVLPVVLLSIRCKSGDVAQNPAVPAPGDARSASDAQVGDLATELEGIRARLQLPALAVAAWRDGELIDRAAVGVRKIDEPASKVALDDRWHLGSNTKAMTATLIGIHVDRGTLRWTDTIGQLLRGWKIDAGYKHVTFDQLIRHEGGAGEAPPAELWKQLWTDGAAPDARAKFVRAILAQPPAQAPGTFVYSNTGYMIAGAMLEHRTGKRWEDLMRSELFDKLGMTSCGFGAPGSRDDVTGAGAAPWGHDAGGTPIAPGPEADNPAGVGPAGTVHCSLADYGKYLNMIATGTPALVTPETAQHLFTARAHGYAGGWMAIPQPAGTMLAHSGSNTLWFATAIVAPARKLAFVVVTNKGEPRVEESLKALLRRLAPTP
jgi:D-alanyl-D-alanine carboxypeptidase